MDDSLASKLRMGSQVDVARQLGVIATQFSEVADLIAVRIPRAQQSLALLNLSRRFAHELFRLERLAGEGIDLVAWCTRNAFELNLLVRYVLLSDAMAGAFLGESAKDEQQILEGFATFANGQSSEARAVVQSRIEDIGKLASKHGIQLRKPKSTSDIAKEVGCADEYAGLFKFMSKYVHPSSWLVNRKPEDTQSLEYWNVLVIHAQMYALDALRRINEQYDIPVVSPPGRNAV